MYARGKSNKAIGLGLTTAMAAVLLSGCAAGSAPHAEVSAAAATQAMAQGQSSKAVQHAEAAVLSDPRNADFRIVLGDAYLDAGRFASAEASFTDAMTLGDASPRAALSLALAKVAQAKYADAAALLNDWDGEIAKADLGLALSLAGQPERGIHIMSNAIRGGENTVKMRQNLAYAFAMAGRWREARLMAQQDLPAGEVNDRMEQWAQLSGAGAYRHRVATLLQAPVDVVDSGQPVQLALANTPSVEQLAFEAQAPVAPVPTPAPIETELAAVTERAVPTSPVQMAALETKAMPVLAETLEMPARVEPRINAQTVTTANAEIPSEFVEAFSAPEPSTKAATAREPLRFVSNPVVQPLPGQRANSTGPQIAQVAQVTPRVGGAVMQPAGLAVEDGSHLVQLGSFASEAGAHRAWDIYVGRFPELATRERVITQAVVRGKRYWRVSAGGYDNASSLAMCSQVRSNGSNDCFTWASATPLPGAVDKGVNLARR